MNFDIDSIRRNCLKKKEKIKAEYKTCRDPQRKKVLCRKYVNVKEKLHMNEVQLVRWYQETMMLFPAEERCRLVGWKGDDDGNNPSSSRTNKRHSNKRSKSEADSRPTRDRSNSTKSKNGPIYDKHSTYYKEKFLAEQNPRNLSSLSKLPTTSRAENRSSKKHCYEKFVNRLSTSDNLTSTQITENENMAETSDEEDDEKSTEMDVDLNDLDDVETAPINRHIPAKDEFGSDDLFWAPEPDIFMTKEEFHEVDSFLHEPQPGVLNAFTEKQRTDVICESIWLQVQNLKK